MEKKYDVVALGEFLIDFTPAGSTDSGMKLFEQNPGGAPVNMLTAVGKAGLKTAFIGKVGDDMHGNFLVETAKQAGIDTRGIVVDIRYLPLWHLSLWMRTESVNSHLPESRERTQCSVTRKWMPTC